MFEETKPGQVGHFSYLYDLELSQKGNYWTFDSLLDLPDYSIAGSTYMNAAATKTFAGNPWDVLRENRLVYDFINDILVPIETIAVRVSPDVSGFMIPASGIYMPGAIGDDGKRVTNYIGWYNADQSRFFYSGVTFE